MPLESPKTILEGADRYPSALVPACDPRIILVKPPANRLPTDRCVLGPGEWASRSGGRIHHFSGLILDQRWRPFSGTRERSLFGSIHGARGGRTWSIMSQRRP